MRALSTLLLVLLGCGENNGVPGPDAGRADGAAADVPDAGAPTTCSGDLDCDDRRFCSGTRLCIDGACVQLRGACEPSQLCDEAGRRCVSNCPVLEDADGDGADAVECGGADCDDGDPERYPGALEICDVEDRDEDCDPSTFGVRDQDQDGFADARCRNGSTCGIDCDDTRSGVNPGTAEVCNGTDDDCDGMVDEEVVPDWVPDLDGDGWGSDSSGPRIRDCERPEGYADFAGDCDDDDRAIHPGALEQCDAQGRDEDCNGRPDDVPGGCDCVDGSSRACGAAGRCAGATQTCNLGRWSSCSIEPVPETCDGTDEDCDGTVDDDLRVSCYPDADGDGYARGDVAVMLVCRDDSRPGACPGGFTSRVPSSRMERDCNDGDTSVTWATACHVDSDRDGHGTGPLVEQCVSSGRCPAGFSSQSDDCCDLDNRAFPGAGSQTTQRSGCGGWDFDCDGAVELDWASAQGTCAARATSGVCTVPVIPGWGGPSPGCGNTANFVSSCRWTGSCVPDSQGPRTESCR